MFPPVRSSERHSFDYSIQGSFMEGNLVSRHLACSSITIFYDWHQEG